MMFDIHFELKTLIKITHLFGLALGIGGALLLDLIIFNFFHRRSISREKFDILRQSTRVVSLGLGLLWISGAGYLLHYLAYFEQGLHNPKVWAKIIIVAILTLNGMLIHRFILPHIEARIGKTLFHDCSRRRQTAMLCASVISVVSWLTPLALGACKELNFSTHWSQILLAYGGLLLLGVIVIQLINHYWLKQPPSAC
ncbi:hypothetical protein [Marinobacterium sedimentorum]|uniref:hypothetical protein n=1 Tax=Marinobacterium sedimentorum TaxID=2927804 RepID=UPI0020C7194C|nr:hypothetical protein [Marinobacterium sedimentorum]MCP8688192.1 hypothetical protein [Marinobacterium sedimentorum]